MPVVRTIVAYEIGSVVTILTPDIQATVERIAVSIDGVKYELGWWEGKVKKTEWVFDYDVVPLSARPNHSKIGFHLTAPEIKGAPSAS